ncbi:hypothetical protein D3C72_2425920 [compost metagenome]
MATSKIYPFSALFVANLTPISSLLIHAKLAVSIVPLNSSILVLSVGILSVIYVLSASVKYPFKGSSNSLVSALYLLSKNKLTPSCTVL